VKPCAANMSAREAWPPERMSLSLPRADVIAISQTVVAATAISAVSSSIRARTRAGKFGADR
jgi:hypothetical protein